MAVPLRNHVYDKIKSSGSLTDVELSRTLVNEGHVVSDGKFNKILLDLEILGLVKVSWLSKDERRIEQCIVKEEKDDVDEQNRKMEEKDYEASFPGFKG